MAIVVLTGGPGAGKTTVAAAVAPRRHRSAVIEVDDVRHMLSHPHVAPWGGEEGRRQQHLGVMNACALARNFHDDGCDVLITDVLTDATASLYRRFLPEVRLVWLQIDPAVALRRVEERHYQLTREEFDMLHTSQPEASILDEVLDSGAQDILELADAVYQLLDREVV